MVSRILWTPSPDRRRPASTRPPLPSWRKSGPGSLPRNATHARSLGPSLACCAENTELSRHYSRWRRAARIPNRATSMHDFSTGSEMKGSVVAVN